MSTDSAGGEERARESRSPGPAGTAGGEERARESRSPGPADSAEAAASRTAGPESAAPESAAAGPELARAVLDAALARRRQPVRRRRAATAEGDGASAGSAAAGGGRRRRGWSGPGPDPRDPQLFGAVLGRLVRDRGWEGPAAEATLFGQWERVVGPDVAAHCRPVKLEGGELTVEATSTAWATQLRLLAASLLRQIAAGVGHNVVTKLHIHGPAAPSWNRGPRRVRGRGPRDTYG